MHEKDKMMPRVISSLIKFRIDSRSCGMICVN